MHISYKRIKFLQHQPCGTQSPTQSPSMKLCSNSIRRAYHSVIIQLLHIRSHPLLSAINGHLHWHSLRTLALRSRVTPRLLQGRGAGVPTTVLLIPPSRILPFRSAHELTWRESSKKQRSQDHHTSFKDHESDLIIGQFAAEPMSEFCDTKQGTDEDEEGG